MSDSASRHDSLLRELNEERVAALTRISRTLESLLIQLAAIAARLPELRDDERERDLMAYRQLRQQAARYRWYLEVQREAVGLRHHRWLDEFYRLPDPL